MSAIGEVTDLRGAEVRGPDDQKIGKIDEIYLDDRTGQPEWALVKTGLIGSRSSFVPLRDASRDGGDLRVPFDKEKVKGAPSVESDQHLSPQEEMELFRYYGVDWGGGTARAEPQGTVGHDTSGPTTDQAMTRSEEELAVGTQRVEAGRARLRKYVVTEHVQTTVPVQREEVVVEREPITDANVDRAMDGPAISEEEHEVTLHEERPVVSKQAVPKERVRLDTQTVQDEVQVEDEVRKERIETEGDVRPGGAA